GAVCGSGCFPVTLEFNFEVIVNTKLTSLTLAAVVAAILAPMSVLAAPDGGAERTAAELDAQQKQFDAQQKELDAQLAEARARLEEAAHEVAEISSRMSEPVVDHMMSIYEDGPPRAVLGVQLDERSGKDGARVQEVSPGGAAAEAGLRVGDVITSINGVD